MHPTWLPLFAFHSRFFPRALLMSVVLQFALLLGTSHAIDLDVAGRARDAIEREAPDASDVDVKLFAAWAERHQATVRPIANTLAWTFAGYVIWLPALFVSTRVRTVFARDPASETTFTFRTTLSMPLIMFDGRTYRSAEEMPADVRERYEKALASVDDDGQLIRP